MQSKNNMCPDLLLPEQPGHEEGHSKNQNDEQDRKISAHGCVEARGERHQRHSLRGDPRQMEDILRIVLLFDLYQASIFE